MLRSIATTTLSGSLTEKIRAISDAGFDGIEIFENDILYSPLSIREIRDCCNQAGLDIVALQPFRDFEALPSKLRQRAFDRAVRKLDTASELGTLRLLICSNVSPEALDDPDRAANDLAELAELASERGIEIGYEALAWGRHVRDVSQAWSIVEKADHPSLGIVLDSFHLFARGNPLQCLDPIPVEKILIAQVADAPDVKMDVLQLSRHFRCFPGQGDYPVAEFMAKLNSKNYAGYVSHEIFSDEFRAASPALVANDGFRSLSWLASAAAKEAYKPEHEARSVEFIEFATDDAHRPFLIALLKNLGFVHTHKHKSKSVSLYQQGQINIVLNAETDSFSNEYFQRHGVSVCAIGIGVNNPSEHVERLKRRRYAVVNSDNTPDEMDIPAVHGVGNSLIYLCPAGNSQRRFIDIDFEEVAHSPLSDNGLTKVDHIGQSVDHTEFLSSLLFYRDGLGFEPESQYDLVDPRGMMMSRTLSSKDGSVRIPINTSHSSESSVGRFREKHHGSGTQQLAFACDDIFTYARSLNPERILPIPDNYYDDLSSRYVLDADRLSNMRTLNILYDEDDNGFFFNVYLREVNGLFIEILQREGYKRFGEINAAVRLASQAREDVRAQHPLLKTHKSTYEAPKLDSLSSDLVASVGESVVQPSLSDEANLTFRKFEINANWISIKLKNSGLKDLLGVVSNAQNLRGCLLSEELQSIAYELVDHSTVRAQHLQSINVLRREADGVLHGDRLDGIGVVNCLETSLSIDISTKLVWVHGCDNSAFSIAYELAERGVESLVMTVDSDTVDVELIQTLRRTYPAIDVITDIGSAATQPDILINSSPKSPPSTQQLESLDQCCVICNIAVSPVARSFLKRADTSGFETFNDEFISREQVMGYLDFFKLY